VAASNITEILTDLFFVERGYLNANHLVYRGSPPVLIDSGYIADFDETARILQNLGVQIDAIGRIITTHCHCDHIGGHKTFYDRSGCSIWLHELGRYFIENRDDWSTWWKYYHQQADFFPCAVGLKDSDEVRIGPHVFEVLHTPGHASDGIVLYHRKEKLLISSDTLWQHDLPVHTVRVEGNAAVYQTKQSLEKIAGLEVKTVCPGHGPWFTDFNAALQRSNKKIDAYLSDRRRVGADVLKKITVYTVLMNQPVPVEGFYDELMATAWFKETVDLYFESSYRAKYQQIIGDFLSRDILQIKGGSYITTVRP
jgi:glyoxylase-like metal-dependent hydrolase (beta-lactamase superfamily II)